MDGKCFVMSKLFSDEVIVRDFFSHFNLSIVIVLHVRERELFLTLSVIHNLFNLPDIDNDDYSSICEEVNVETIQDILRVVTVLGTKWTTSRKGTRYY